ncbi:MAG: hypothetical protein WBM00_08125 [Solirubrobacterales bacterium]
MTAKLSKAFYDKLGEEVANELVSWFNAVDSTYRSELRDLNELNFARFDAKLEQRIAEVKAELRQEVGALRTEMHAGLAALKTDIASTRADLLKWMFLYWAGTALTVIGLLKL